MLHQHRLYAAGVDIGPAAAADPVQVMAVTKGSAAVDAYTESLV